jgi:type II secretory pathway pseudopilin PulG
MAAANSSVVAAVPAAPGQMRPARPPLQDRKTTDAFTMIELLVVMAVIIILAGLIFAASSYVQNKGRRARAETEIAALSAALENYKADNGVYPSDPTKTDGVDPILSPTPAGASLFLYEKLSGDSNDDRVADTASYFSFKPNQLSPADPTQPVAFIQDPFRNSYGYSTARAANPAGTIGNNPSFDLWSTANETDPARWIKNW